ncbi:MAG: hypothetical protein WB755_25020, partial [Terriglobales bacterium]
MEKTLKKISKKTREGYGNTANSASIKIPALIFTKLKIVIAALPNIGALGWFARTLSRGEPVARGFLTAQ